MQKIRWMVAVALLAGAAAWASIPGATAGVNRDGLLHVCVDVEPGHRDYIVCDEQVGGDPTAAYTGAECSAAGLPPECVVDLVPGVRVSGRMTLIADEDVFPENPRATVLFRFRAGGQPHLLADTFNSDALGLWNPVTRDLGEAQVFEDVPFVVSPTERVFLGGNLTALTDELTALVEDAHTELDLGDTVPIVVGADALSDALQSDHSGFDDTLASVGRHRIRLRFARVRP